MEERYERTMTRLDNKCDNCGDDVKPDEGDYWITGHYLCPKCMKKWNDNYDTVIKSALDREKKWEEYEKKSDEQKISEKIESDIEEKIIEKKEREKVEASKKKGRKGKGKTCSISKGL